MKKTCELSEIAENLKKEKSVAIFCHVRPDGDCIGSAFGLKYALNKLGIIADVYSDDDFSPDFFFLSGIEKPLKEIDKNYTAFVAVDISDEQRIGRFLEEFCKSRNTYNIDHHVSNTYFAKYNYVYDCGANCENIFKLINMLGVKIGGRISNFLATGLITDTGAFKHKNVTPETMLVASKLLKHGADFNTIIYNVMNKQTKERAKLFGLVMSKIRYFKDNRIGIAAITLKDIENANAKAYETEGFVDFVLNIDSVEIAMTVMEIKKDVFKISLRSKGADVCRLAQEYGGGGHVLASGCQIAGELEEVIDKISFTASKYLID